MKPNFTEDGIEVQTFDEIVTELSDGYKTIYGSDINLDSDSPDGQRVAIEAQARLDLQSFGIQLYNQLDPDFAIGQALNRLVKFSGISRQSAVRSYVSVTITADRSATLPIGYTVSDDIGQNWKTLETVSIVSGANTTTLYAENFGAISTGVDKVTIPVTIIIGVLSVTNAAIATIGEDEETDEDLRIRRNLSLATPETSSISGLYSALADIKSVTKLKIYENDTDSVDVTLTLDPHTIWCIVEGGTNAEIGEVLAKTKNAGTGLKGGVTGTYNEEITLPDGTTFTYAHNMLFDIPSPTELYVKMTLTEKDPAFPIVTSLVSEALVAKKYDIGENASASELYSIVYGAGDTFVATGLEVGLDGITYTAASQAATAEQKFTISTANIAITTA